MTENTTFFGAQRGAGPPHTRPQARSGALGLSKTPDRVRLGRDSYLGKCQLSRPPAQVHFCFRRCFVSATWSNRAKLYADRGDLYPQSAGRCG
jgi:hypothetical protein